MAERRALRRAELALAALGITAVLVPLVMVYDAVRFHGLEADTHVALGIVAFAILVRALLSLRRRLRAQCALLRRLPILREIDVHGHRVRVIAGDGLEAFCAGLLRPAVYVSEGTLATSAAELRAILAHEEHHRARRDPLRVLCARMVSDALPLPPFAGLAEREIALADLAADAATVEALGDRAPLASALVRFEDSGGIAPERVDRLLGAARPATIPSALLFAAAATVAAIVLAVVTMLVVDWHLEVAALLVVSLPAYIAARRAGRPLRPVA